MIFTTPCFVRVEDAKAMRTLDMWLDKIGYEYSLAAMRANDERGCYMVDIPLSGQAHRRTRMAEAACKELNYAGYNAFLYYQRD